MRKGTRLFWTVVLVSLCCSCTPGTVGPEGYAEHVRTSDDLVKKIRAGGIEYTFRVQTPEAVALKYSFNREIGTVDIATYTNRLKEVQGHVYVNIDMKVVDQGISSLKYKSSGYEEYEYRVKYYEFEAISDMAMNCNGRTIAPLAVQFENHQGLSPQNTLVAVFPLCMEGAEWQVQFNDKAMNNLFLKAAFSHDAINKLPKLEIQ